MQLSKEEIEHYNHLIYTSNFVKRVYKIQKRSNKFSTNKIEALFRLSWYSPEWAKWKQINLEFLLRDQIKLIEKDFSDYKEINPGLANFYRSYRGVLKEWIRKNSKKVNEIIEKAATLKSDKEAREIIKKIDSLSPIRHPSTIAKMNASSLLTPLVALLDPRLRFPVINKRQEVLELHSVLKIKNRSLISKFEVLQNFINQNAIKDSMYLDAISHRIARNINIFKQPKRQRNIFNGKILETKNEESIEYLRKLSKVKVRAIHNTLTNNLKELCKKKKLVVKEGYKYNMFDILIENYEANRDLLIEAKGDCSILFIRHAIGQLFDYRRKLQNRALTDLALLVPGKPDRNSMDLLNDLGISCLWFDRKNKNKLYNFTID